MGLVLVWTNTAMAETPPAATGATPTGATPTDRSQPRIGEPWKRSPSVASDEANRAEARTHAAAAFTALDNAGYEAAVTHFTKALTLVDAPTLRVGRGDALVRLGRWVEAKADYRAAIAYTLSPEDSASFADSQANAETKLAALEQRMPHLRVNTAAEVVEVTLDNAPPRSLAAAELLELDPGSHQVVVSAAGRSVSHTVQAREREDVVVDGPVLAPVAAKTTAPAPVPVAAPAPDTDAGPTTPFVVAASITGALAIGTVVTGALFLSARSEYDASNNDGSVDEARVRTLRDRAVTLGWVNTGLLAGTVVGAGVTTYFWLAPRFDGPSTKDSAQPASGLGQLTPSGIWLGTSGQF